MLLIIINASYQENALPVIHIKILYITLAYQILWAKTVLSPGLILLHYSEFVSNKQSNVPLASCPSVAVGPRNNVPARPPLIGPNYAQKSKMREFQEDAYYYNQIKCSSSESTCLILYNRCICADIGNFADYF